MIFICDVTGCGATFTIRGNLTRHQKSKHTDSKHKCGSCDKTFSRSDTLKRHEKICVEKSAIKASSKLVDYNSRSDEEHPPTKQNVRIWIRNVEDSTLDGRYVVVSDGVGYICGACDKPISRSQDIQRHMKTCKGKRAKLRCQYCNLPMSRVDHLRRHQKKACKKKTEMPHLFSCKFCKKRFPTYVELEAHAPNCYRCQECKDTFETPNELNNHQCQFQRGGEW